MVLGKASGDANAAVSSLLGGLPGVEADAEAEAAAGAGLQDSEGERMMTDRQIARVQRQVNRRQQLAEFREEALQLQRLQRVADAQNGQQEAGAGAMQPAQPADAGVVAPTAAAATSVPEASLVAPAAPSAGRQLLDRAAASVRYCGRNFIPPIAADTLR